MPKAAVALIGAAVATGAALAVLLVVGANPPRTPDRTAESSETKQFLAHYLQPDGRIVRTDQGADTVSEGQAYALLLTAAVGDEHRFDRTWSWTHHNLNRADHLFS